MCVLCTGRHVAAGAALLLLALLLGGCAPTPQLTRLEQHPLDLPPRVELTKVAFFPQQQYQCGPAALATLLNRAGDAVTPEQLAPEVYLPARKGSLQLDLVGAARRHGFVAYLLRPRLDDLLTEVAAGHPVLVLQNLALRWVPRWHYAVVVGYDLPRRRIVLRSGAERRHDISLSRFEHTWRRADYWALLVLKPGVLPRTAEPLRYVQAVVGLEQVHRWRAARTAYAAAWRRWPGNLAAGVGLGNSQYALGDLSAAARTLRTLTKRHPESAVAYNNLATVLADQGRWAEAERAARRAVAIGGADAERCRQTLRDIRQRRP